MKLLSAILCVLLSGCCTTIYSRTGKPLMRTYADISQGSFTYRGSGETITWTALDINHSHPTAVALHGAGSLVGAAGLAVASALSGNAVSATARIVPPIAASTSQFKPSPTPTPKPVVK